MKKLFAVVFICLSLSAVALDGNQKPKTVLEKFKNGFVSPLKNYEVCYLIRRTNPDDSEAPREIWLYPLKASARKPILLCGFVRDADVLFSPDENWIAVNDWIGSNVSEIILFKKVTDFRYVRMKDIDPGTTAWILLEKEASIKGTPSSLTHAYSEVKKWAGSSTSFILALNGRTDENYEITDWFCTFDLQTMKACLTPKQREKNKGAVHFNKHKKPE